MKDFILIFRLDKDSKIQPSPEQIQARMNWLGNVAKEKKLSDKGNTLSPISAKTIKSDKSIVDEAHSEGKEIVTGYMIVKSETIDEAVEIAKANPILAVGGSIEVREIVKLIKGDN